jgi:biopolymer transport protein ExbB
MLELLARADALGRGVALLLLVMSMASWVIILRKAWLLQRAALGLPLAVAAFWQSPDLATASGRVAAMDRLGVLTPLLDAAASLDAGGDRSLAAGGDRRTRLTRLLRDALAASVQRLQTGQVWLATVGATAPFVGLLGTVWGIHQALAAIGSEGAMRIELVAAPVGEALVMTAAGLAVALPAVLAYNLMGRRIARLEADLEGFAHDLRELLAPAGHAP